MKARRSLPVLLSSVLWLGCSSVSTGPAGSERQGVPKLRPRSTDPRPAETLVIQERELRFDERLRLYRVTDLPDHYYSAGWFYRPGEDGWERARRIGGRWTSVPTTETPPTLLAEPEDPPR